MSQITIVGLGPGDPELITRRAWTCLTTAPEVWCRTRRHPSVAAVAEHTQVHSYDELYDRHDDFAAVYQAIAADVVARGEASGIIYAVPGDPSVAEATTQLIRSLAAGRGVAVTVEAGVSFLEASFAALGADPIHGVQIVDAIDLANSYHPLGSPRQGMLVAQLYSRLLASDVKLTLMNAYPDDHPMTLITGAGTPDLRLATMPLFEIDRHDDFDDLTSLWVPPVSHAASYTDLQDVIAHLRGPVGCPWDREQTHESLRPYLLEETYEVLQALDEEDPAKLVEELGDLLIQVSMHIQIATEEGEFKLDDVIHHVTSKLVRRHPHVFGDVEVDGVAQVVRNWESIKQEERAKAGTAASSQNTLLDGIPRTLPSLALAQGYVERLVRVGYPLPPAAATSEAGLGQALLNLVEQAQAAEVDAESALRRACEGLRSGLDAVQAAADRQGTTLVKLPSAQQRALWAVRDR